MVLSILTLKNSLNLILDVMKKINNRVLIPKTEKCFNKMKILKKLKNLIFLKWSLRRMRLILSTKDHSKRKNTSKNSVVFYYHMIWHEIWALCSIQRKNCFEKFVLTKRECTKFYQKCKKKSIFKEITKMMISPSFGRVSVMIVNYMKPM